MSAAEAGSADSSNGIKFVNKNYGRRGFLGQTEKIACARSSDPHEHFNKFRGRHMEKRHSGLAGYGLGKQGFSRSGGAHQQYPLGNFRADVQKPFGAF